MPSRFLSVLHGATGSSGVVPAEAAIVDSEVMRGQTQRMRNFSHTMRGYMRQNVLDTRHRDAQELDVLMARLRKLDHEDMEKALELDCLAAVADKRTRTALIRHRSGAQMSVRVCGSCSSSFHAANNHVPVLSECCQAT